MPVPDQESPETAARVNYRAGVHDGDYFMVESDQLHSFVSQDELGDDVRSALLNDLGVVVGEHVLPIAHWKHESSGPLSVSLNVAGELVLVISAEEFEDQDELLSTLSRLEQWLTPMGLRELSELSGNPSMFVEGLRELGPNLPLTSMLRVILINPAIQFDSWSLHATLPFCRVETLIVEAFRTTDGLVAIRKVHQDAPLASPEPLPSDLDDDLNLFGDEPEGAVVDADLEVLPDIDLTKVDPDIDLTKDLGTEPVPEAPVPDAPRSARPLLLRGRKYPVRDLPLRFDVGSSNFTPLCNEMFAAGTHLAVVVDLDESKGSPFETTKMFRWDGSEALHGLFERNRIDEHGRPRTVHLFTEHSADGDEVSYVGTVANAHEGAAKPDGTLWLELQQSAQLV